MSKVEETLSSLTTAEELTGAGGEVDKEVDAAMARSLARAKADVPAEDEVDKEVDAAMARSLARAKADVPAEDEVDKEVDAAMARSLARAKADVPAEDEDDDLPPAPVVVAETGATPEPAAPAVAPAPVAEPTQPERAAELTPMDQFDHPYIRKATVTKKDGQRLGISIEEDLENNHCKLITFLEEGAVPDAKAFRENDIILAVDDNYVDGLEHGDVVQAIMAGFPSFELTVINEADLPEPDTTVVIVTRTAGKGFGVQIAGVAGATAHVEIHSIRPTAQVQGELKVGDQVVGVNGTVCSTMAEITTLLTTSGNVAKIRVLGAKAAAKKLKAGGSSSQFDNRTNTYIAAVTKPTTHKAVVARGGVTGKSLGMALIGDGVHTGHMVAHLVPGGPAAQANVKVGSELIAVNGKSVQRMNHAGVVSELTHAGDTVEMTLSLTIKEVAEVRTVSFERVNNSFGMQLVTSPECQYLRVLEVVSGGAAETTGKVNPGEQLIAINHKDLSGMSRDAVIEVLGATEGVVEFTFHVDESPLPQPPVAYILKKNAAGTFGLAIVMRDNAGRGALVGRIMPGTPAETAGVVAGADLISVNGKNVDVMPYEEVVGLLVDESKSVENLVIETIDSGDGHITIPGSVETAEGHTRTISLKRETYVGWGFVFAELNGVRGHFVTEVVPGSIADGSVHPGDLILTVNGTSVTALHHELVTGKLKSGVSELELQVVNCQYMPGVVSYTFHRPTTGQFAGECGLQLLASANADSDVTVQVRPDSPAEHAGIVSGMTVLTVGDTSVVHAPLDEVTDLVSKQTDPIHLVLAVTEAPSQLHVGRPTQASIANLLTLHTIVLTRTDASVSWGFNVANTPGQTGDPVVEIKENSPASNATPNFIVGDVIVDIESDHGIDSILGLPHDFAVQKLKNTTGNTLTLRCASLEDVSTVFPTSPKLVKLPARGSEKLGMSLGPDGNGFSCRVAAVFEGGFAASHGLAVGDRVLMIDSLICSEAPHEASVDALSDPKPMGLWILPDDSLHHHEIEQPPPPQTHIVELIAMDLIQPATHDMYATTRVPLGFDVTSVPIGAHIIDKVVPNGLAAKAGVKNGDQLYQIGNMEVFGLSHDDVLALLKSGRGAHGGNFLIAVHRRIPIPFRLFEKEIPRPEGHPLGITFGESNSQEPNLSRQVYVASVQMNSPTFVAGDVQAGDLLVMVNGVDVSDASIDAITHLIMSDHGSVRFVLARSERHGPQPLVRRTVRVTREEGQSLGCLLMHAIGERTVIVAQIEEGGPAFNAGVHAGDCIFKVNGVCLTGKSDEEVVEVLAGGGQEMIVEVGQHKDPASVLDSSSHRTFTLQRKDNQYGLKVLHTQNQFGEEITCIVGVAAGSAASQVVSLINVGDIIVSVNGTSMIGAPESVFVAALNVDTAAIVLTQNPNWQDDNTPAVVGDQDEGDTLEISTKGQVRLNRSPNGSFGVSICHLEGHLGTRIESVIAGGPAEGMDIDVGDIIFAMNGQPTLFDDYDTVLELFQHAGAYVDLILADASSGIDNLKMVHVQKEPHQKYGLDVVSVPNDGLPVVHRVGSIAPGSVCEAVGQIFKGDTLISIDGINASNLTHAQVIAALSTNNDVVLVIREDYADMPKEVELIKAVIRLVKTPTQITVGAGAVEVEQGPGVVGIRVLSWGGGAGGKVNDVVVAVNGRNVLGWSASDVQALVSAGGTISILASETVETVVLNERTIQIQLTESNMGIGFAFQSDDANRGGRIVKIVEGSASAASGLNIGDQIISIGDTPIQNLSHEQINGLLQIKSAAGVPFRMQIQEDRTPSAPKPVEDCGPSVGRSAAGPSSRDMVEGTVRTVVIKKSAGEPVGIALCNAEAPVQIFQVHAGSPADQTNMIFKNDIVLEVNGVSCQAGTISSVTELVKCAGNEIELLLQSCEHVIAVKTVQLTKVEKSIGLQLVSSSNGLCRILAIAPGSAAAADPECQVGDIVFGVNGVDTHSLDVMAVSQLIAEGGETVTFILKVDESPITREVVLDRSNGRKLGFSFEDRAGSSSLYVKEVFPDGQAATTGLIHANDRILEINGEDATEMSHANAVVALTSSDTVQLHLVQELDDASRLVESGEFNATVAALTNHTNAESGEYIEIAEDHEGNHF
jgi:C-terminal processing protease CtpA/Prc